MFIKPEEIVELENEVREVLSKKSEGEYYTISLKICNEIIKAHSKEKIGIIELREYIDKALDYLFDLKGAIIGDQEMYNKNDKIESFYTDIKFIDHLDSENIERILNHSRKIDINSLNELIVRYYNDSLHSPTIEWYLVNIYLTYVIGKNLQITFSSLIFNRMPTPCCNHHE